MANIVQNQLNNLLTHKILHIIKQIKQNKKIFREINYE